MMKESLSSYQQEEQIKNRRRVVYRFLSIISILLGLGVPLLIIIDFIPNSIWLLILGTGLIGIGFLVILLISSGEI